jgi:NAD(P)-dependent dehydrogenase (short-subunit alcohol dehydrogenase family)
VLCDIRDEAQVIAAIEQTVAEFGGIDICVNNASAISLTNSARNRHEAVRSMMGSTPWHLHGVQIFTSASEEGDQSAY